jgi:hypothetical protein
VSAGSSGTATLSVTIPLGAIGGAIDSITVTATGTGVSGSASCTAQATVTEGGRSVSVSISPSENSGVNGAKDNTPPPTPSLISPTNGANVTDNTPTLDWSDVSDPSGVTYDLSIAMDSSFVSITIQKTGLTASTYKLTLSEALAAGTYYWRVRSVDGSGNASSWSESWSFTVSAAPLSPASSVVAPPAVVPLSVSVIFLIVVVVIGGLLGSIEVYLRYFRRRSQSSDSNRL